MDDNVPEEDKLRRLHMLDDLQEEIVAEINKKYLGEKVDVLFEEKVKERWRGRTPTNKLVFVESEDDLKGKIVPVTDHMDRTMVDAGESREICTRKSNLS